MTGSGGGPASSSEQPDSRSFVVSGLRQIVSMVAASSMGARESLHPGSRRRPIEQWGGNQVPQEFRLLHPRLFLTRLLVVLAAWCGSAWAEDETPEIQSAHVLGLSLAYQAPLDLPKV